MTDTNAPAGLKSFADWHVSCNGGNISPEAEDAYAVLDLLAAAQARVAELEAALQTSLRDVEAFAFNSGRQADEFHSIRKARAALNPTGEA